MKKDHFASKYTRISPSVPCTVAVKRDSHSFFCFCLFLTLLKLSENCELAIFHNKNTWFVTKHVQMKMRHTSIKFPCYFMLKEPIKWKIANIKMFYDYRWDIDLYSST